MRTLLIIITLIVAALIIKRLISTKPRQKKAAKTQVAEYTPTVRCQFCGAHIPSGTALNSGDAFFCDDNHYTAFKNSAQKHAPSEQESPNHDKSNDQKHKK